MVVEEEEGYKCEPLHENIMQFPVIMAGNFKLFMEEKGYDSTHTTTTFLAPEKKRILLKVKKAHILNWGSFCLTVAAHTY